MRTRKVPPRTPTLLGTVPQHGNKARVHALEQNLARSLNFCPLYYFNFCKLQILRNEAKQLATT